MRSVHAMSLARRVGAALPLILARSSQAARRRGARGPAVARRGRAVQSLFMRAAAAGLLVVLVAGFATTASAQEPPTNLVATPGDREVTLTWTKSTSSGIHSYWYDMKVGNAEFGDSVIIPDSGEGDDNETSYTITGLTNGVQYTFRVRARQYLEPFDQYSLSGPSNEDSATPMCTPPGAPDLVSVVPTGFGKLTLNWNAPTPGTCGAIDGYEYQVKRGTDGTYSTWTDIDNSAALTSYEVTSGGLGEVHYFKLRATSGTNDGTESAEESGTAWAAIEVRLDVPSSVREDAGSVPFAVVAETPASTGRPDFQFTVNVSTAANTATYPSDYDSLSFGVTFKSEDYSEDPNTPGRFTARLTAVDGVPLAITIVDDGVAEDDEMFGFDSHIPRGTPAEFTAPTITIVDDDHAPVIVTERIVAAVNRDVVGQLEATDGDGDTLTWSLTGGADRAVFELSPEGVLRFQSGETPDEVSDAGSDGVYVLAVEVTDGANPVVTGTIIVELKLGNPPGAPTDLEASGGRGAVALTWEAPEDDGGVAIQRYEYRFRSGGGYGGWLRIPDSGVGGGNERSFTVTDDLFGLTAYTFEVRAVNAADAGPASAPATVTTLAACSGGPGPEAATEDALRLEDGDACRGRLEVYHDERWGTVCDDRMGSNASRPDDGPNDAPALACRAMGYEGGRMVPRETSGMSFTAAPSSRPIWLDDVYCPVGGTNHRDGGPLNTLSDCRHAGWGLHNCSRNEDVWVECTGAYVDPGVTRPPPAVPMLSVADAEATEGEDETLDFTVTLEPEATETVTVEYATATTIDDTATEDDDYEARTGRLIFAPGVTSQTVSVPIVDDSVEDGGETFTLTLSDAVGATIAVATATGTINNDEAGEEAALTAEFVGMPSEHDGTEFTFRVQFSEDPDLSYKVLESAEDGAFEVGGGTITRSKRVNGQHDLREIYVEPSGVGDVTIELAGRRACGTAGAICTTDGKVLSTTLTATVKGPAALSVGTLAVVPLTAEFVGMPPEHDGTEFTFRVQFSEDPAVSYKVLKSGAFEVTGGTIAKAKRVNEQHDLREIYVEPSGVGDVTLKLAGGRACDTAGAICTSAENGSKVLSGTLTATVKGPAAISVADAKVEEADGATLDFVVSLSRDAIGTVTVNYATENGDAKKVNDYVETNGTLTFVEGERTKTVEVEVVDDDHDEGTETMTLVLSDATGAYIDDGVATGTIENSDAIPQAWLARFGRTVTGQVIEAVEQRLQAPRVAGVDARLAGQALPAWRAEGPAGAGPGAVSGAGFGVSGEVTGREAESRALTGRDFITGTSFTWTGGSSEGGGLASLWGRGSIAGFDGREGDLTADGEVTTGLIGADWATGQWTAGLALGHSTGTGGYRRGADCDANCSGGIDATLTGFYPFAGLDLGERLTLWAAAGWGSGEVTVTPGGEPGMTADLSMSMGAAGVRSDVLRPGDGNGLALAVKGEARFTRTSSDAVRSADGNLAASAADVWLVRLGLEGSRPVALGDGGATLTPSVEIAFRHDGGDAETGTGADLGAGVAFADPAQGLALDLQARGLVAHAASGFREWGASLSASWDPRPATDHGLSLSLRQSWGASPAGGMDALFAGETLAGLAADADGPGRFEASSRLEGEVGYGLALSGGGFTGTPNLGFGRSGTARDYRIGWRLAPAGAGSGFSLDLDATRRESVLDDADAEHGVMLRGALRW